MNKKEIVYLIIAFFLASCSSKIYFTSSVRTQILKYNLPLEKIQFYVDRKIILTKETQTLDSAGNRFFSRNIIKLRRNTPGVCKIVKDSMLYIAFEKSNNNYLIFGINNKKKSVDPYQILAVKWLKNYGIIDYEESQYYIPVSNAFASIKIDPTIIKRIERSETKKRILEGLKVIDNKN